MASESSLGIFLKLPRIARLMILGNLVNQIGALIGPFLTLVLVQKFDLPVARAGLLVSLVGIGTFTSVLIGGWLTDQLGRRRTLLLSLFGSGTIAILLGLSARTPVFYPLLLFFGFTTDLFRPSSSALLGDVLHPDERASGYAALRVAHNVGGAVSLGLGGLLLEWNWRILFFGDGITTLAFGVLVFFHVVDAERSNMGRGGGRPIWLVFAPWLKDAVLRKFLVASILLATVFTTMFTVFPLTVTRTAGYPDRVFGALMSATCLMVFFFEIVAVKRLSAYRRLRVCALGAAIIGVGFSVLGLFMHWAWFMVALTVITVGEISSFAMLTTFLVDWAPPQERGQYLALSQANWRIAAALCPIVFLPLYERLPVGVFWLVVSLAIIPSILLLLHLDRIYDHPELLRGRAESSAT